MRFSIFTHAEHFTTEEGFSAYAPYVREMNIWVKHFEEVEIVAPLNKVDAPNNSLLAYQPQNINFTQVPSFHFLSLASSIKAVFLLPAIFVKIFAAMKRADHIHLRCPGNIGLAACFVQVLFPKKPKTAKYAGNWDPAAKQPWTYKLQKAILKNPFLTRNIKVLVYGDWPQQSKNIVSFFTASFPESFIQAVSKEFKPPYKFVFAGTLVAGKNPFFAIKLIDTLLKKQVPVTLDIYGNGMLYKELQEYIDLHNLDPFVTLHGNQKQEILVQAFKKGHFTILPSNSEGWPKAVAEGMFFGCVPIATNVSCVPWMLGKGERGILMNSTNVEETANAVKNLLSEREKLRNMSNAGQKWSQEYTLEKFEEGIKGILLQTANLTKKRSSPVGRGGGEG